MSETEGGEEVTMSLKGRYMKAFFVAVIMLALLPAYAGRAQAQNLSGSQSFLLRLPAKVDTTGLQFSYFMTGAFGEVFNFVKATPTVHDYEIDTSYKNMPAKTLKIIIYCPGYSIELLNIPSLTGLSDKSASVELKPLPAVRLTGKIVAPERNARKNFKIEVSYVVYWVREFFGSAVGFRTTFKLASVGALRDGSFSVAVPDFTRDPAIASFKRKGAIELRARDPKTGNFAYRLESAERPGIDAEFEIAPKYNELVLYAKPYR
jgi:hypothetical protein